jgi:spore germination protein GerM
MKIAATVTPSRGAAQQRLHSFVGDVRPIKNGFSLIPRMVRAGALPTALLCAIALSGCTMQRSILTMGGKNDRLTKYQPKFAQVRVWFVRERNGTLNLTPVVRTVATKSMVHDAINELLIGPTDEESADGLSSEIPRGTVLIGVDDSGENIELNLSQRFSNGAGTSLETRLEQLRRTIVDSVTNRKVYLDVEGKRLTEASGEGLEVKQPINM